MRSKKSVIFQIERSFLRTFRDLRLPAAKAVNGQNLSFMQALLLADQHVRPALQAAGGQQITDLALQSFLVNLLLKQLAASHRLRNFSCSHTFMSDW